MTSGKKFRDRCGGFPVFDPPPTPAFNGVKLPNRYMKKPCFANVVAAPVCLPADKHTTFVVELNVYLDNTEFKAFVRMTYDEIRSVQMDREMVALVFAEDDGFTVQNLSIRTSGVEKFRELLDPSLHRN